MDSQDIIPIQSNSIRRVPNRRAGRGGEDLRKALGARKRVSATTISNKYRACSRDCCQINKRAIIPALREGRGGNKKKKHKQAHPSLLYKYWALQSYRLHEPLPRLISCCQSCELFSDKLGELRIAIEPRFRALITLP